MISFNGNYFYRKEGQTMVEEKNKKRIYRSVETTEQKVDRETGEILSESFQQTEFGYVDTEPQYIKIYLDCILRFKNLSSSLNPILVALCKHMHFADKNQIVFVNKYTKELICSDCGVKIKRVEQAIKQFTEAGILKRQARGVYIVNPYIISRGSWEDIKKLRATFDFMTGDIDIDVSVDIEQSKKKQKPDQTELQTA